MKKTLLLFVVILIAAFKTFAQPAEIMWGSEAEESRYSFIPVFLGEDESGYLVLRLKNTRAPGVKVLRGGDSKGIGALYLIGWARFRNDKNIMDVETYFTKGVDLYIERYDRNLKLISQNLIDYEDKKSDAETVIKKAMYFNGNIVLFSTHYYKKEKKTVAGYQLVSEKGELGKFNALATIPESRNNKYDQNSFEFILSPDEKKILVFSGEVEDDKAPKMVNILTLNADFEELSSADVKIPVSEKDMDIEEVKIDNKGQVTLLTRVFLEGDEKKDSKQKFKYVFYIVPPGKSSTQKVALDLGPDRMITDIKFQVDEKNDLVVSGFYSEKSGSYIKGNYFMKINGSTMDSEGGNVRIIM